MSTVTTLPGAPTAHRGLNHWMERVLKELEHVRKDPAADPVHDLRVAIRRCRSLGAVMQEVDPDPAWRQMRQVPKKLFRRLGALRDAQIIDEWVKQLAPNEDPLRMKLHAAFAANEPELRQRALRTAEKFEEKSWSRLERKLRKRARLVPCSSLAAQCLAVERFEEAKELHTRAQRTDKPKPWHELRVGLKRLRYTVESLLPEQYALWSDNLKRLQDLLGEVHDLDVLWSAAARANVFPDLEARSRWQKRIGDERARRIETYRNKMLGKESLWQVWRAQLPDRKQIESAAWLRLKLWASLLDPDFKHSLHVMRLALQLYDGLAVNGKTPEAAGQDRAILGIAALLHDVGRYKGEKGHHKASYRMIRRLAPPLGWTAQDLLTAGIVARYHRGTLPQFRQKPFQGLSPAQRRDILRLAAVLRLANAFDARRDGRIQRLEVQSQNGWLQIAAQGYSVRDRAAESIAAARHLLETVYHRPVMVKPMKVKLRTAN